MRGFIRSRFFQALVAFFMVVAAIVVALLGHAFPSYAASSSSTLTVTFSPPACGSPLTIVSLNKGDQVSGTAELKDDGSGAGSQGTDLLLQETAGSFTQTVALGSGPQSFSFTAARDNDSLTACVKGGDRSNLTATVSLNGQFIKNFDIFNTPFFRSIFG